MGRKAIKEEVGPRSKEVFLRLGHVNIHWVAFLSIGSVPGSLAGVLELLRREETLPRK